MNYTTKSDTFNYFHLETEAMQFADNLLRMPLDSPIFFSDLEEDPEPIVRHSVSTVVPTRRGAVSPQYIDHTYHDYSNYPTSELPAAKLSNNFPSKLHQILSDPVNSHIISWMPHGRAWKVHSKELLMNEVLPKYFAQNKYQSFTRQLNGWGFKRLNQTGNDSNAFYHECFLRGMPQLVVLMKRVSPNQGRLHPHVEGEPNFYEIDKYFKLPPSEVTVESPAQIQHPPPVAAPSASDFQPAQAPGLNNCPHEFPTCLGTPPPSPPLSCGHLVARSGYPAHRRYNPVPYGLPPHYSYPLVSPTNSGFLSDDASSSSAGPTKGEEDPFFIYIPTVAYSHSPA